MSGSKAQTVGYKYYLGMHLVLCHGPVDAVTRISADGKVLWTGSVQDGVVAINQPGIFGGEDREGGVVGNIDIMSGKPAQARNSYLQSKLGASIPAFRGVVSAVLNQVYLGMSPYLKNLSFRLKRIQSLTNGQPQWYSAKADVGGDLNFVHIIRECLTDTEWGLGYQATDVDDTSFQAAADLLYTEGLGGSVLWERSTDLQDFIQLMLKHIDGALYVDRTSGKFKVKLARNDYTVGSLLHLNDANIARVTDFKRALLGELTNQVTLKYWDKSLGKDASVTVQDLALAAQQGYTIGTTVTYNGITNGTNAAKVASRELRTVAAPLAAATLYAQRVAAGLNVGDVFKMSWTPYGLSNLVMRVTNVELGELTDNLVKITCVEDVFAMNTATYIAPPTSGWVDPVSQPAPSAYRKFLSAPYYEIAQQFGDAAAQALGAAQGYGLIGAVRPSSDAVNMRLYSNDGVTPTNPSTQYGLFDFCPSAVLSADVGYMDTRFFITGAVDMGIVPLNTWALVDNEAFMVTAVTATYVDVARGVLDTIPAKHLTGARLFFMDVFSASDMRVYPAGSDLRYALTPTTGLGTLALGSAPIDSVPVSGRHFLPYPPANVKLNGVYFPTSVIGQVTLTWASRNRLTQTASLTPWTSGNITAEAGTTYKVLITNADSGGSLVDVEQAGLSWTDSSNVLIGIPNVRVRLWTIRDGYASFQLIDWTFRNSGFGRDFGNNFGGTATA